MFPCPFDRRHHTLSCVEDIVREDLGLALRYDVMETGTLQESLVVLRGLLGGTDSTGCEILLAVCSHVMSCVGSQERPGEGNIL